METITRNDLWLFYLFQGLIKGYFVNLYENDTKFEIFYKIKMSSIFFRTQTSYYLLYKRQYLDILFFFPVINPIFFFQKIVSFFILFS